MASGSMTRPLKAIAAAAATLILGDLLVPLGAHGSSPSDNSSASTSAAAESLHSKRLIYVKIYCLIIMLVGTFLAGVSPYFFRWNESFLLLGTQFAGGVFLGTAMMHFLGDSTSTFITLTTNPYPFSFMLACAGYLLTMLSDCVIQWIVSSGRGESRVEVVEGKEVEAEERGRRTEVHPTLAKTSNIGDTILLILALCFHSVFEGIAVGVSGTQLDAWRNLWTISLHKIFAAIAMGIALLKMSPDRPLLMAVSYALAFAISSPVGVGIGIAIDATTQGAVADWVFSISMALASGVFIYVAINHLIAKGFNPLRPSPFDAPFYKYLAVLLGVTVIAVVLIWD
ncbi:unnamed protein product [Victoria cruziana]